MEIRLIIVSSGPYPANASPPDWHILFSNLHSKPKRKTTQRVVFLLVIRVHFRYCFSILKLFCRPWAARESEDSFAFSAAQKIIVSTPSSWRRPSCHRQLGFSFSNLPSKPKRKTTQRVVFLFGGECEIRTHGSLRNHQFSRLAP